MTLNICHYAEYHHAQCRVFKCYAEWPSVVLLSVVTSSGLVLFLVFLFSVHLSSKDLKAIFQL